MSKKSGFTGANAVPLGPRNPKIGSRKGFSNDPPPSMLNPGMGPPPMSYQSQDNQSQVSSNAANALKAAQAAAAALAKIQQMKAAERPPEPQPITPQKPADDGRGRARKRKSRWGTPDTRTEIPGIPAKIPANLTTEQQKAYIIQLQIEDVTRKLKSGDLGIAPNPEDRSPSPEPIYNNEGKRLNTREYRTRKRLEEERHKLIQDMLRVNEHYKPPMDYKAPVQRISEQIMIPADLNPSINFVGLLIGPRGNTLKKIEKECQCKIMIRGKGSVKEGKIGRKDGMPLPGEDEPLHALITGMTIENVQKAAKEIHTIIKQGIEQPEGQNDLRKLQLMELARLNGTLRDDAMPREREWLKPENQNITNTTVCTKCGGRGHIAQDCLSTAPSVGLQQQADQQGANPMNQAEKAKMDSEYMSLMAELGEAPPPGTNPGNQGNNQFGDQKPPWMSEQTPQPLMSTPVAPAFGGPYGGPNMMGGAPPPWMRGGPRGRGNFGPRGRGRGNFRGGGNNFQGGNVPSNDGSNNMAGGNQMWMNQPYDNSMYNASNMDGSMGPPGMMPPPPPPPGSAPQPPLPPGTNPNNSWQQNQWGSENNQEGDGNEEDFGPPGTQPTGSQSGDNSNNMGNMGGNMQGNMGNMQANMGYGMMGYGMWGGMGNMAQPPMPPGPGPVPPPPPGNGSGGNNAQTGNNQWGNMDYSNMGGNMMGGMGMMPFSMPPAPPPPPPSS